MPTIPRKLEIELVPKSSWYNNLRKVLPKDAWQKLSRYVRSNEVCDICGRHLSKYKLHAHEKWSYNDVTHEQRLEDILCLCEDCHRVKHIGRANAVGEGDLAKNWFLKVNQCSEAEFEEAMKKAFAEWMERSEHPWTLDTSLIDGWLESHRKVGIK